MENEKRLIDADLLLHWVEKLEAYNRGRISSLKKPKGLTPEGVRHMIDTMPKVDAVEVVHGRWIPAGKTEELAKCSVCGTMNHTLDYVFLLNMKYCPYCGARMDGGNVDE